MIKTFHEAPKSIFPMVQSMTDGDYALVHLFETDPEYYSLFEKALAAGREVILDNSIFELGEAFDMERFLYWIQKLKPTYYIVPDVLEDSKGVIENLMEWMNKYLSQVPKECKMIGVVQGKSMEDLKECYWAVNQIADKIAISFDYSLYQKVVPHPNKLMSYALGRVAVLSELDRQGIINRNKPHHLLGCAIPGEGLFYPTSAFPWIDSVDTSNPVMHGMLGVRYGGSFGLTSKARAKMCDQMDWKCPDPAIARLIADNIVAFRHLWNGKHVDMGGLYS